jgi:DNA-binding NtrC family response regulator
MPEKGETRSLGDKGWRKRPVRTSPCLFLQIESERPLAGPARYLLHDVVRVLLGRGPERRVELQDGVLRIQLPDAAVSSEHAELRKDDRGWVVRDAGSRNGTVVDSRPVEEQLLQDGAVLQVGGTFFKFRAAYEGREPALLDSKDLSVGPTGLRTFSPAMQQLLRRLEVVAPSRVPVLLQGESGTGKELLARAIHRLSGRTGAFVALNCGAIAPNLVEGELFGYRKGAFSGADRDHPGLLLASSGGTLFLDEIGDLPLQAQAALLRVLQESEVLQVGTVRPQRLDLRVVAATHRDLEALAEEKQFRHDLHARLDGISLAIPPLRDRLEDVPLLIATLVERHSPGHSPSFSPRAAEALLSYDWPMNVRELENALVSALALSAGETVEVEHLPRALVEGQGTTTDLTPEERAHREELLALLREHHGNLNAVARVVGKGRTQVVRWVSRYGFNLATFRRR